MLLLLCLKKRAMLFYYLMLMETKPVLSNIILSKYLICPHMVLLNTMVLLFSCWPTCMCKLNNAKSFSLDTQIRWAPPSIPPATQQQQWQQSVADHGSSSLPAARLATWNAWMRCCLSRCQTHTGQSCALACLIKLPRVKWNANAWICTSITQSCACTVLLVI
jgi:hypothetical protein